MSEQTLLMLFVALVAAASIAAAAAAGAVAWAAVRLLGELRLLVRQLRDISRAGEAALKETGERLYRAADAILPGSKNTKHGKNR